jgi:ABC-type amino acid transport substrate-binding protein
MPLLPSGIVRIGIDPSVPPFAFYESGQVVGFEIDLGNALAVELGGQIEWVTLGFDGLYDALRADHADVIIATLNPDPLRANDALYTRSYYDAGLMLVSSQENNYWQMRDVAGGTLAFAFGSLAHAESDRWLRRISPYTPLPYEQPRFALDAVRIGRADAALISSSDAHLYLREHPQWHVHTAFLTHQPYVIAANPRAGRLVQALNRALDSLEADGTLAMLMRRWLY